MKIKSAFVILTAAVALFMTGCQRFLSDRQKGLV